jgi:hypothetical protein
MADSILRLKLDSGEYENKIKRATQGLLQMERECRSLGGTLAYLETDQRQFVSSLGRMDTKSQTVKGRVNELSAAYTELRAQYNRLTDEEKKGDFGKALNQSLGEMRERVRDGKQELKDINGEINTSGGMLDALSAKFGVSVTKLGAWGAALGVAKGVLETYSTALSNNESIVDGWGATVEASESLYRSFANALVAMDFGNFFANMDRIVKSAREAYDALDELQTKSGVISNAESRYNAERAKYQKVLKDPKATAAQKADARKGLERIAGQRVAAVRETQLLNNNTIRKKINEILDENFFTPEQKKKYYPLIVRSLYDTSAVDELNRTVVTTHRKAGALLDDYGKPIANTETYHRNLGDLFGDETRNKDLNPYVQGYWNAETRMYQDERRDNRIIGSSGGGGKSGGRGKSGGKVVSAPVFALPDISKEPTQLIDPIGGFWREQIEKYEKQWQEAWTKMGTAGQLSQLGSDGGSPLMAHTDKFVEEQMKIADKWLQTARQGKQEWQNVAVALGQVGQAFSQIKNPALSVVGTVGQAIATVALAYAQAQAQAAKTSGPWGWIAFAATGLATMINTISAIKSSTAGSYASGGVIGGNNYNDGLSANVSSGEVIFNKTDAGKLYDYVHSNSALGGGRGTLRLVTEVSGSDLRIVLNNDGRQRGVGRVIA